MALSLQREQTPELAGIPPEAAARLLESGGKLELPPIRAYIRLGAVEFPQPRHLILDWEIWPTQVAARERTQAPQLLRWNIAPEPVIFRKEERDAEGKVIVPALVLPTFDALMARSVTVGEPTLAGVMDAVRTAIYSLAAEWPEFSGAEVA